jgi:hypothetical protein
MMSNSLTRFLPGILIWRIWRIEREIDKYLNDGSDATTKQPRYLQKVMRIIAESGAAYTLTVIATFIVDLSGSNALYPTSDMASSPILLP